MAKFQDLTTASPADTSVVPGVQDPAGTPLDKKFTFAGIWTWIKAKIAGNAAWNIQDDGSAAFAAGNVILGVDGSANFSGGKMSFGADGSASFANGAATIGADGLGSFANGAIHLETDGSAYFGNGTATIGLNGSALFRSTLDVKADSPVISLLNSDDDVLLAINGSSPSITFRGIKVGGTLKVNTTTTGNIGAGEDDLITFTIPANTLANDGEYLEFDCWGSFAATATSKQLKVQLSDVDQLIFDTGSLLLNGKSWRAHGKIVRTSDGTATCTCEFTISGTLLSAVNGTTCTTTALSGATFGWSNSNIFKVTGQDNGVTPANNAVVQNAMVLLWFPAQ